MYQLSNIPGVVIRLEDGATIPLSDEDGGAQREYAEWLDEGNAPMPVAFDRTAAMQRLRDKRKPVLDALAGLAGRLDRKGRADEATAADTAAQAMLDLPNHPLVQAATDDKSFDKAVLYVYRMTAAACPPSVQSAFLEAV